MKKKYGIRENRRKRRRRIRKGNARLVKREDRGVDELEREKRTKRREKERTKEKKENEIHQKVPVLLPPRFFL